MGGYGGVSSGSCQILAVLVRDVLALRVLEALSQSKIDDKYLVFGAFSAADQKVVWLDVAMYDAFLMDLLNT